MQTYSLVLNLCKCLVNYEINYNKNFPFIQITFCVPANQSYFIFKNLRTDPVLVYLLQFLVN